MQGVVGSGGGAVTILATLAESANAAANMRPPSTLSYSADGGSGQTLQLLEYLGRQRLVVCQGVAYIA